MPIDTDKIDETVLALLHLTLHDRARAWKGHDWEALNRLHRKGMIGDPVGKAKSVVLTEQGLAESERLFRKLFARAPGACHSAACRQWRYDRSSLRLGAFAAPPTRVALSVRF